MHFNALNQRSPGMANTALAGTGTSWTVEATTSPIITARHNAMTICTTGFVIKCHHGRLVGDGVSGASPLVLGPGLDVGSLCLHTGGPRSSRLAEVWSRSGSWVVLDLARETLLLSLGVGW